MATADRDLLTAAALALAGRGWRVFPVRPGGKRPAFPDHDAGRCDHTDWYCRHAGRHVGWEQRATTDRDRIARCWTKRGWNMGVAAGPSGLLVLDLDMPKNGETPPREWAGARCGADVFATVAARAGHRVPATFTVTTPSGGQHLYFTAPPGHRLRNTQGDRGQGLGWKIDTRGHGGYVLAPASTTPTGTYTITNDQPPAPLPTWLTHSLVTSPSPSPPDTADRRSTAIWAPAQTAPTHPNRYLASILNHEALSVQRAPQGQHNHALFTAALTLGRLVAGHALPEHTVRATLTRAYRGHLDGPCDCNPAQAQRTITSGLRYSLTNPRHIQATPHQRTNGAA